MARPSRPSADKTREAILLAAKEQFLRHGYDATYIKDIAQAAKVNTNLIFHHFENKEMLWRKVKGAILAQQTVKPDYDISSAKAFFKSVLDYRFDLYEQNPDLVRLIQWQQLTENERALIGSDTSSPSHWLKSIKTLQKKGEIKSNVEAEQILLFIIYSAYAPFMQHAIPLTRKQKTEYKTMILTMCEHYFLTRR